MLGGVITFEVIKREVDFEQQRFLRERLTSAEKMIERRKLSRPFVRDKISIIPLDSGVQETKVHYSDTIVMHSTLQRLEPHIKLDVIKVINNRPYKISMYDLIIEEDDIADGVQESLLKMYLLLTFVVLILSGLTSLWILKPFNKALQRIKDFSLMRNQEYKYEHSSTSEFNKLNQFLEEMTRKMQKDYQAVKEFTENAAHEIQTPLTIASGKLEILLNTEKLSEEQSAMIISAQQSLKRLSKMNQSLLLLTKIDNKEFENVGQINISAELERQIFDFEELIELKSITLNKEIEGNVKVEMDAVLCGILITNLVKNAIRHNFEAGRIKILLNHKKLIISNTGEPLSIEPQLLFDRFKKGNQSQESLGLGLAIVKKICDVSGFEIGYKFKNDEHQIEVTF